MERPIKLWSGSPSRASVCRLPSARAASFWLDEAKKYYRKIDVQKVLRAVLESDKPDCVRADDPRFVEFAAITFDDLAVLLRYQENLVYACEKWKP